MIYTNTEGKVLELSGGVIRAKIKTAGLYDWEYEVDYEQKEARRTLYGIVKNAKIYEMILDFTGSRQERREALEKFREITEVDMYKKKPGKLQLNGCYLECFIIGAEHSTEEGNYRTVRKKAKIFALHPFWITEDMQNFWKNDTQISEAKKYKYRYPYRYGGNIGKGYLVNRNITDTNFTLRIYGPVANPQIIINGHPYLVNETLDEGEYICADSRKSTIVKISENGEETKIFDKRQKGILFFKKIPSGTLGVEWTGKFTLTITLYEERNEPKWE